MVKRETKKNLHQNVKSDVRLENGQDLKKKVVSTPLQTHPTAFVETFL